MKKIFFIPDFIISNVTNKDIFLNSLLSFLNDLEKNQNLDIENLLKSYKLNLLSKTDLIRLISFNLQYSSKIFEKSENNFTSSSEKYLQYMNVDPNSEKYLFEILSFYNDNISIDFVNSLEDRSANEKTEYFDVYNTLNTIFFIIKPGFSKVCFSNECYAKIYANCIKFDLENKDRYLTNLIYIV